MIVVPANPNSIHVGMIRTGCLKTEFNSAYPARLRGIINQHEFQESIRNINSKISYNKSRIFCVFMFVICLIGGIALMIIGATMQNRSSTFAYVILIAIGAALIIFASFFLSIGCCIIRIRRTNKMRKAIAEESKKYSSRSPGRCSWRLHIDRLWTVGYGRRVQAVFIYRIMIDIPHTAAPNPSAPPQYDFSAPPPYPGQSVAFCSQCGVQRSDFSANFCASCGHQYNK